jgi:5,10-methylenetetrahydromethanopterin reductase
MIDYRISIAFQTNKAINAYGDLAMASENYGFDTITVYNDILYQPAWLPLMEIARNTKRCRIGVGAVNPFTMHPINIAGSIALIDEMSKGRAYLGLARGAWLDFLGLYPQRSPVALREAFKCIRHLLSGDTSPLVSDIYPLAGGDSLRWQGYRSEIPFLLGSWGLQTIKNCRAYIHEIKLGGSANPDAVCWYREHLNTHEDSNSIDIVMGAVTVIDEDGKAAKELARREVALYLPVIAGLDKTLDIDPEIIASINNAAAKYDFEDAANYISDELLYNFAFAGTPADIIEHTGALFDKGADRVEYGTPHGLNDETGLKLLGKKVLPAFLNKRDNS